MEEKFIMDPINAISDSNIYIHKDDSNSLSSNSKFEELLKEENILNEFAKKYGLNVVGSTRNNCCSKTTLMIAPNILKEIANNPHKKDYYEGVIKDYMAQQPAIDLINKLEDNVSLPSTIIFKSDGSWVEQGGSTPSPEKLTRIQEEKEKKEEELEDESIDKSLNTKNSYYKDNINYYLNDAVNYNYNIVAAYENMLRYAILNNPIIISQMRSNMIDDED